MYENFKPIKTIHLALCGGVILTYFFLGDSNTLDFLNVPKIDSSTFIYLLIGFSAVFLGNMLYKQRLKAVDSKLKLEERIGPDMTASIVRWAILEGVAFLILFLKKEFLVVGLFLIVYMIFTRPSLGGMKQDFAVVSNLN